MNSSRVAELYTLRRLLFIWRGSIRQSCFNVNGKMVAIKDTGETPVLPEDDANIKVSG